MPALLDFPTRGPFIVNGAQAQQRSQVVQVGHSSCRERCTVLRRSDVDGIRRIAHSFNSIQKTPTVGPRARNARPSQLDTTNANCVCGNSDLGASKEKRTTARGKHRLPVALLLAWHTQSSRIWSWRRPRQQSKKDFLSSSLLNSGEYV